MSATDPYEEELKRFEHSGPHEIDDERREKNREVRALLKDIMPIDDIHKISDCDLVFKFLIARRWDSEAAAKGLREYATWRAGNKMNEVLWEEMPGLRVPRLRPLWQPCLLRPPRPGDDQGSPGQV